MSPASAGALEVERYIGACLISQNRTKTHPKNRTEFFHNPRSPQHVYRGQNGYVNQHLHQGCPPGDRWAGGVPLISFAGQPRGPRRRDYEEQPCNSHLARLAVHTQGAPLILAKSYNHRKSKPQRNPQATKIFENSNNKKQQHQQAKGHRDSTTTDAVSVTSEESSSSNNSETCLPRIIKPRKRRKKDRKPAPNLARLHSHQDGFSTDSASPDVDFSSFLPCFEPYRPSLVPSDDTLQFFDLLGDISETPKLHHSFEDVEEATDVNGNQPASMCQCRYCDPAGQIWDVDRSCYSPFLTPPKGASFEFPSLLDNLRTRQDDYGLLHSMSCMSLEEDKYKPSFSRSSSSSTSSSGSVGDLEVSTEIVTSPNGHRDLEIKFWLTSSAEDGKSTKESVASSLLCGNT